MITLDPLIQSKGTWRGTNRLCLHADDPGEESNSTLIVTPLLKGRFVRIDQSWTQAANAHEGSMLVGFDPDSQQASLHWIDSFHNGRRVMPLTGSVTAEGEIDVRGTYPAPPGPDWGWRIRILPTDQELSIVMYNVHPEGNEDPAVRAVHRRE